MRLFFRSTLLPLFLIVVCPPTVLLVWHISTNAGGSLQEFWHHALQTGVLSTIVGIWRPVLFGTAAAWKIIFSFMAVQLILMISQVLDF